MSEQAEQYSIEWFRWMAVNNPKWLGTQAFELWRHYMAIEAKLEAMDRLDRQGLDYAIKLQRLIEAFARGGPLPYPELWHHKMLLDLSEAQQEQEDE